MSRRIRVSGEGSPTPTRIKVRRLAAAAVAGALLLPAIDKGVEAIGDRYDRQQDAIEKAHQPNVSALQERLNEANHAAAARGAMDVIVKAEQIRSIPFANSMQNGDGQVVILPPREP